ncbi:MAG: prenyltransferase/squalene oxidase repeat-containing protein [Planctomycetota bacterium]
MAENAYPELVFQKSHQVGFQEPKSFEETLRDLLRSSPYLVISAVIHILLGIVFITGNQRPDDLKGPTLKAESNVVEELPPPPPPPPPPEMEKPKEVVEEPAITENPTDVEDIPMEDLIQGPVSDFDNASMNDVLGTGGGGIGGSGGKLGGRGGGKPGGEAVNASVELALKWLKNHQSLDDGHWSCAAFDTECGKQRDEKLPDDVPSCDGLGDPQFDVGVTSLALLAFLGAGNTNTVGNYKATVKNGLKYLIDNQGPDGNFGVETKPQHTYDHLLATLAVVEACALSKGHRMFKGPAEKALKHMYKIRNPNAAWRYPAFNDQMGPGKENDMSVTGWAIMSMTMAKEYRTLGLPFDQTALEDAMLFLEEMTDPATGRTGYYSRGGGPAREDGFMTENWPYDQSESMTAVGVLCRIFADPELKRPGNKELIDKGAALMLKLPPVWKDGFEGRRDYYYWYYGTYALYQVGGNPWKSWETTIKPAVVDTQHKVGERAGSWDPQEDPWGSEGGRVYSTALLCLTLEVYSRYDTVIGSK